jgi:hypothetical protein
MSKLNILGLISLLGGVLLIGFQGLATFMGQEGGWKGLNLMDVFGEESFNWIDSIPVLYVKGAANYIAAMPLFILLFCIAALFFIFKMFLKD